MTPKQLEHIGKRIWGGRWKSPLARALGMTYPAINNYMVPETDERHTEIPWVVEIACMRLDEHPNDARAWGLTDRQAEAAD